MSEQTNPIHILHVDDEPDFANLVSTFLQREDDRFEIESAPSASDGLERLSDTEFDCIVSDHDMPEQSGIEFLEAVRDDYPDLPFILFTGKGSEEVASEAISAGVTDYLQKESGTGQYTVLANRIQNAVERKRADQERQRQLEAIETAAEGISILDSDGYFMYVNNSFSELHGYDREELIGNHWEMCYRAGDVPEVRDDILSEVEQTGYWRGETDNLRADGTTITVDHSLSMTDRDEIICTVRDISDQKERQEKLRQRTVRLEALFENSPDMINFHDIDGNIHSPNPSLCEMSGYTAAELTDMKVWELDEKIDPNEAKDLWTDMEVGESHRLEGVYPRNDGSTFPVEVNIQRLSFEQEDQFVVIARDITTRKEYEQDLERQHDLFRKAQEIANLGAYDHDISSGNLVWSDHVYEIHGVSREFELTPDNILQLYHPDDRPKLREAVDQAITEGEPYDLEVRITGKDDGVRWIRTMSDPQTENGEVVQVRGIVHDITAQKEREQKLKETTREFQAVLDTVEAAIFIKDIEGRYHLMNKECRRLLGVDPDEDIAGLTDHDLLPADVANQYQADDQRVIESGETLEIEEEVPAPEGTQINRTLKSPFYDEEGQLVGICAVSTDITEHKKHERQVQQERDRLDEFASVVSHDLRNPLRIAEGNLELLKKEYDSDKIEKIDHALTRMYELIEDLLTLAREGTQVSETESVDLAELSNNCWQNVATADATIHISLDRPIRADRSRLAQLLENLIRNAVEHAGEDVTVTIGELEDGFYVEDDGRGISRNEREEVFKAGYSTAEEGTGFGLSIVKQVAEAHGWDISVTDGSFGGTRFEITSVEFAE